MRFDQILDRVAPPPARSTDLVVPRSFLDFLAWVNVTPTDGQAELARVAYDGQPPKDRKLAERIFGSIDFARLSAKVRRTVAHVVGGRAGKTFLLIALRLLWGALVRDLSVAADGEDIFATVVAQNDKLRQQAINFALGCARKKPELAALIRLPKNTKPTDKVQQFGIYRPDFDRVVVFQGAVATAGGLGVRGVWHTDLALDECAFFRDASFKVNDKDIYEAGISRILPGGQCILGSTPWAKAGLLYEVYRDNYGNPETALVAHAPTLVLNDRPEVREVVELEYTRNEDNAKREYGAIFMEAGTTVFFESTTIELAIVEEPFVPQPGDMHSAGGDFAFISDSSALIIAATRHELVGKTEDDAEIWDDVIHVYDGTEERPSEDSPLQPSVTCDVFAEKIAGRCSYLMADNHYRASIEEHLHRYGLFLTPAPTTPSDGYVRARMLMRQKRVKIHPMPFRDRLVQQLREVHGRPTAGGRVQMHNPRWATGGHGDIAAAFVLALYQASGEVVAKPPPAEGSPEAVLAAKKARHDAFEAERNRPHRYAKGGGVGASRSRRS